MSTDHRKLSISEVAKPAGVLIIAGIILVAANLRAPLTAVGPLMTHIRTDTGLSNTLAGLLTTLPLIAFAGFSLLAPRIGRRFGMEQTLFACMVILTGGILLRSAPSVGTLLIGTVVVGVAIAICNVLLPGLIKRDFPTRIGLLTGLYSLSMNVWAGLGAGLSIPLVDGLGLHWRGSLMSWAVLSALGIVVMLPMLRKKQTKTASLVQPTSISSLLASPLAWKVTLFMGLQSISFYVTITWLPEILMDRGVSAVAAGWYVAMSQLVSLPFSFIVPVLAGRSKSQSWLAATIAVVKVAGFTGLLLGGNLLVWVALIGISQGSSISLALTLFGLRTSNASEAAALSGMAQSVGYLLAAIGPIVFGLLYDLTHTWTASLLFVITTSVLLFFMGLGAGRNAQVTPALKRAA